MLDRYKIEGGVWITGTPVLVNEDFDFGSALALPDIGPGLAAAKRTSNNRAKADALAGLALGASVGDRLDAFRKCGVNAWFLLWGSDTRRLTLVADRFVSEDGVPHAFVTVEGPERAAGEYEVHARLVGDAEVLMGELTRALTGEAR